MASTELERELERASIQENISHLLSARESFETPWNHINEYNAIERGTITPMASTELERASVQENISHGVLKRHVVCPPTTHHEFVQIEIKDDNRGKIEGKTLKSLLKFISKSMNCPPELRVPLALAFYAIQTSQVWALGNPVEVLSSLLSSSSHVDDLKMILSLKKAIAKFLPNMIWSVMLMLSFTCTVMLVQSLPFRVPIVAMLVVGLVYYMAMLAISTSEFDILIGSSFKMSGLAFSLVGSLGFGLLLAFGVFTVLFAWWLLTPLMEDDNVADVNAQ